MRLSPHFVSSEFDCRDGTRAPAGYLHQAATLCSLYLEPLRREFGVVRVVSGFRSVKHNAAVGGASQSMHLWIPGRRGAAADVVCARGTPTDWYAFLNRLGVPGLGRYPTFVHADNRRDRARW